MPQMSAWRQAQELTRKAEEEAMLAEKKSQEAYVWYFATSTFNVRWHYAS